MGVGTFHLGPGRGTSLAVFAAPRLTRALFRPPPFPRFLSQGGSRMFGPRSGYSSKDAVAHTEMKARQDGQDAAGELEKRDLKKELLEREAKHFSSKPNLLAAKQLKVSRL